MQPNNSASNSNGKGGGKMNGGEKRNGTSEYRMNASGEYERQSFQ